MEENKNEELINNYYGLYLSEDYNYAYLVDRVYCDKSVSSISSYLIDCLDKGQFTIITDEEFYQKLLTLGINKFNPDNISHDNSYSDSKFLSLIISKYNIKNKNKIMSLINKIKEEWIG